MRAMFAHEHADSRALRSGGASTEDKSRRCAAGASWFRRSLNIETSRLRQVNHNTRRVVEVEDEIFGPSTNGNKPVVQQRVSGGRVGLERRESQHVNADECGVREKRSKSLGQSLHLGQFGHVTMYPLPFARPPRSG
jgi:hypothetical protein